MCMKLTKEECLNALEMIVFVEGYMNLEHMLKDEYACSLKYKIMFDLINEHFDNPPLTLEELERMQDEPIWDDWAKEWLIFNWNCDSLECLLCRDSLGNWLHLDFEENRFFRKKVQEDVDFGYRR